MTVQEIQRNLQKFIYNRFYFDGSEIDVEVDVPVLEMGIDSMDFFIILQYIQDEFELEIPETDITLEHFGTIEKMSVYICEQTNRLSK